MNIYLKNGTATATLPNGEVLTVADKKRRNTTIMARKLIEAGIDGDELLYIYRDESLCFVPAELRKWADLTVSEPNTVSCARLVQYNPHPLSQTAQEEAA